MKVILTSIPESRPNLDPREIDITNSYVPHKTGISRNGDLISVMTIQFELPKLESRPRSHRFSDIKQFIRNGYKTPETDNEYDPYFSSDDEIDCPPNSPVDFLVNSHVNSPVLGMTNNEIIYYQEYEKLVALLYRHINWYKYIRYFININNIF